MEAPKRDRPSRASRAAPSGARGAGPLAGVGLTDRIADSDRPVAQDVRVDAGTVHELAHEARAGELLQVRAGLAQLHAVAEDIAAEEPPADQVVEAYATDGELAARRAPREPGVLSDLRLH